MKKFVSLILAMALIFTMAACGKSSAPAKLAIATQPKSVSVNKGETATFTVKAAGADLSYQWQWRKNASSEWANSTFKGNDSPSMEVPGKTSRNGYQYRCAITNSAGTIYTDVVTLTVK